MLHRLSFFVLAAAALSAAHAAPEPAAGPSAGYQDMDALLAEKGLIDRLGAQVQQARASMSEQASSLVINAMAFLGVPYKWGGDSHDTGFDCSGFVRAVYEQSVGKILPRRSDEQAAATQVIDRSELKPGDLVFFNTMRRAFSHVGIYVGDGKFIHSPRTGKNTRIDSLTNSYWKKNFTFGKRFHAER